MKIIGVDNFDRENHSDVLVAESLNEYYVKEIVKFLNDKYDSEYAPYYFRAVSDNYKLYEFKP